MGYASYHSAMLAELKQARFVDLDDNFDSLQLGDEPPPAPGIVQECLASARARFRAANDLAGRIQGLRPLARALAYYVTPKMYFSRYAADEIAQGEFLYDRLVDERSRALLVKLIAYRILGHRKVKLPRNT